MKPNYKKIITVWVRRNFGQSEVNDASWDIEQLAEHISFEVAKTYRKRLDSIRKSLRHENISTGELVELQSLIPYIEAGDVELLEAAGVSETN